MRVPVLALIMLLMPCVLCNNVTLCPQDRICVAAECVDVANEIQSNMDNSTNPCDDFYQYACGDWMSRQFLTPHRDKATTFVSSLPLAIARKLLSEEAKPTDISPVLKAKSLYASCVNYTTRNATRNAAILNIIQDKFHGWPLVCTDFSVEGFNLEAALVQAIQLGVHPLFTLQADPRGLTDPELWNRQSHLYITKPVLAMPFNLYQALDRYPSYRKIYASKIVADARQLGIEDHEPSLQDALDVVRVEVALAQMYNNLSTIGSSTENLTLGALDRDYGQILNWTRFVSTLASDPAIGITDIRAEDQVVVTDPQYLRDVQQYFTQLPTRVQANYVIWRVVDTLQTVLIDERLKLKVILTHGASNQQSQLMTALSCSLYVSQVMDLVVHRLLYNANLNLRKNDTVMNIIGRIKDQFVHLLFNQTWIHRTTRSTMRNKIDSINEVLSFYEESMNNSFLDSYYSNVTIDNSSFLKNVVETRKFLFVLDLKSIRQSKRAGATALPHEMVSKYCPRLNRMYITSVVTLPPFFFYHPPWSMSFAGLAPIIGHEVIHGFDTTGIQYDKDGRHGSFWDAASLSHFHNRTQCLVDQYNRYVYEPAGMHVNGSRTLDANIADNGGVKLAYNVYKEHTQINGEQKRLPSVQLSNDQVFFVKFAQLRCTVESELSARKTMTDRVSPDKFRVNGPLQNFPEFATAFSCPVGSPMNPARKCTVW